MKRFVLLLFLALSATFIQAQTIRYVKPVASGSGNGSSWANASSSLQGMINISAANDQVWVAAGTYWPGYNRYAYFSLKNGVAVYGGFAGTETALEDRDWTTNVTILSGEIGVPNDISDNCYHVVKNENLNNTAVLDGFTVSGGNADEYYWNEAGGGMYNLNASPTVNNCIFSGNSAYRPGGGMYNEGSSPVVSNCTFSGNTAYIGGGMRNYDSSNPTLTNCTFTGNTAQVGGGMGNYYNSSPSLTGCTFSNNTCNGSGGGLQNELNSSPSLANCTFTGNSAHIGGGLQNAQSSAPVLTNCTFTSNTAAAGGGMSNSGSSPSLTGCTFTSNSASSNGGGMGNFSGSAPTVANCTFTGNTANDRGAGMANSGASSPTVTGCTFSGNTGAYAGGGMSNGYSSNSVVTNCTFTNNTASTWGGGMHNESDSSPTITGCVFSGNTSDWGGGMENIFNSSPTLANCSFSGNTANYGGAMAFQGGTTSLTNCLFYGNTGNTSAGGIRNQSDALSMVNCTFNGNTGGAIANMTTSLNAVNCIFWGNGSEIQNNSTGATVNYSIVQGGYAGTGNLNLDPIFADPLSGDLHLQECSPAINAGTNSGAPATDLDGNPRPYNSITDMGAYERQLPVPPGANSVWYIDADGDDYGNTLVQQCARPANGYMLSELSGLGDCNDGNAAINPGAMEICDNLDNNCNQQIDENYVCCPVNVVYVKANATGANDGTSWANAFTDLQAALALTNTCPTFSQIWVAEGVYKPTGGTDRLLSFSLKNGIAIYGGFNGTESQLSQRDWEENETILSGDIGTPNNAGDNSYHVVYNSGINNTAILDGFTIRDGNANGNYPHYDGAGMFNTAASPTVNNCVFRLNTASSAGGGMANFSNSAPALNNCTFTANQASSAGGVFNQFSNASFSNCSFEGNTVSWSGGGMYNYTSSPTLDDCTFSGNTAVNGAGMINLYSSSPELNNCVFSSNSATTNGGGIGNEQSPSLSINECEFSGNMAQYGGGIYNQNSSPVVTDCLFSGNTATERGGGMYNFRQSAPQVTGCVFTGNNANRGGGMCSYGESNNPAPVIRNSSFKGNLATLVGGGMDNSYCTPSVINCVFSGNDGSFGGGGMYNAIVAAPASVWNCSFSGNTAVNGGGVLNSLSTSLTLSNCIFWGNSTETGIENNGSPVFQYSIIKQASGVFPGIGNLNLNPLFVSQPPIGQGTSGDLRLQACSPAIDMGSNSGAPAEDIEGNLRPFNSFGSPTAQTDMGAWEYQQTQTPAAIPSVSISGPEEVGCAGATYTAAPVNGGPSPIYTWKVNGLSVGVSTSTFTTNNLSTGDVVSCDIISSLPCAYPLLASSNGISVTFINDAPGDPAVFGDNEWRVYAWNAGGAEPTSGSWNTDYRGYYIASGLNFFTQSQWNANASPSSAPGYQGCAVGIDNHSWSAKRRGFTCGYYKLSVTSHDDAAQLWIDGAMVWEHIGCCDSHSNVWEGFLDGGSEVEFRVTEGTGGSHGGLAFQQVTAQIAQTGSLCNAASATLALQNNPIGDYLWSTGETTNSITVTEPGTYSVTVSNGGGCSISASANIVGTAGDPAEFGEGVWNVYAWNAGGTPANSWNTDYAGFYTTSDLSFATYYSWSDWGSPSQAPGYQGCPVNNDNHSWSAKRRGFDCGYYRIDIPAFDEYAQLWVDGAMVWDASCCGYHSNVWSGFLDSESEVEFRVAEGSGSSYGVISFQTITPSLTGLADLCSGSPATLAVQGNPPGNYLWSNGETTPSILITAPGAYSVTIDNGNGCSVSTSGTATGPSGNPADFGNNVWNVYAWNAGGAENTGNSWNTSFAGYYTASGLNFNTVNQWPDYLSPSAAVGYQGCTVGNDNHSYSAKRRGFPCDIYSININSHDDAAQLWINGVMVWEHVGCCDSHSGVWTGVLSSNDEVEFRVTEGGGASNGAISFQAGVPLTGTATICFGAANGSVSAPVIPGLTYAWSNGATTATISNLAAGQYCVTPTGSCGALQSQCFTIGNYPQLPPLSIIPDGPTTVSPGTQVELCSSVETLTGNIYTLYTGGYLNKYTVDFNSNTLTQVGGYSTPYMSTSYGIDRNPVTGQVFVVALNASYYRSLYSLDLATNALVELGPVFSTGGSNNVQSISFDHQGNLFAVFQGGVINEIDYTSPSLTPTNLPVSPGIPWNGYVGLTYDFDNNRLIYTTGYSAQVYGINPSTGASNLILSSGVNAQAVEYVGDNKLYCSGPNSNGWNALDLGNGSSQAVNVPGSAQYPKDILYVPGSSFEWSGPEGSLGEEACITVAPQSTSTYTLVLTDQNGCSASAAQTITVVQPGTTVSGYVLWEHNQEQGVNQASVKITGDHSETIITGTNGFYSFYSASGDDFSIKPTKNINKLNGVTAADASAIQQHVANVNPLPAPYKRIAADVNRSNSITTLDATLINQALLGNQSAMNQITSWRFVPSSYTFPNPNLPWGFPEKIDLEGVSGNVTGQNFLGIKLGDVVATFANPANFGAGQPLVLRTADRELLAGQTIWVDVTADQLPDLAAFQFALGFDPTMLRFESVEPLQGLPMTEDHFGAYNASQGEFRVVWSNDQGLDVDEAAPLFRLVFTALESGAKLSDVLFLGEDILPGKAFNGALLESEVQFVMEQFTGTVDGTTGSPSFRLLQNHPNPFNGSTTLRFVLDEPGEVQLRVLNMNGQELWRMQKTYPQGENAELLQLGNEVPAGFLFCEMVTPSGKSVLKMAYSSN